MDFHKFNYIGSKYKLLPNIVQNIEETIGKSIEGLTVGDLFSGTAICSYQFRTLGCNVISNDYEFYGYVIARAFNSSVYNDNIEKTLELLKNVEGSKGLVYKNFSPGGSKRMYFTEENALKIDGMREEIEKLKDTKKIDEDEYYYVLTCLLLAADKVANITSVYGAYLKKFKKSAEKPLDLKPIHKLTEKNEKNKVYNDDIVNIVDKDTYDVVYLDPPYNARQYSKNYHILNYIGKNKDLEIKGVTGLIQGSNISMFCKKSEILKNLEETVSNVNTKWLFMSYNSEGLLSKEAILKMMGKYGKATCKEMVYKRFKSNSKGEQNKTVMEYIFCLKKEEVVGDEN